MEALSISFPRARDAGAGSRCQPLTVSLKPSRKSHSGFACPLRHLDYLDRSPLLSEEERRGIVYLLQLAPSRYLEFERQARVLSRVTQPLMDVLALFQQRRPKSRVFGHCFLKYLLH